jgi:hypothetical protein
MKPAMLRLLQWLAIAIATLVCADIARPGHGIASLGPAIEVAASDVANAVQRASAPQRSHYWRDGAARPVLALEVLDSDIDGGDALYDVADGAATGFKGVSFPRESGRALRCQPRIDTSRFAIGTGLPRGPPASRQL